MYSFSTGWETTTKSRRDCKNRLKARIRNKWSYCQTTLNTIWSSGRNFTVSNSKSTICNDCLSVRVMNDGEKKETAEKSFFSPFITVTRYTVLSLKQRQLTVMPSRSPPRLHVHASRVGVGRVGEAKPRIATTKIELTRHTYPYTYPFFEYVRVLIFGTSDSLIKCYIWDSPQFILRATTTEGALGTTFLMTTAWVEMETLSVFIPERQSKTEGEKVSWSARDTRSSPS